MSRWVINQTDWRFARAAMDALADIYRAELAGSEWTHTNMARVRQAPGTLRGLRPQLNSEWLERTGSYG